MGSLGKMSKVVGTTLETKWRNPINLRKYKRDRGNHEQKKGKGGGVTRGRQRKKTPKEKKEKKLKRKQENQVVRKRELWQK